MHSSNQLFLHLNDQYSNIIRWFGWSIEEAEVAAQDRTVWRILTSQVACADNVHTTLYGSAAGCRSIQKTCAFWKHGLTSKITHSQLTYFCKSNINQTFTNSGGMIWGVRIAIFTEIRHLVEELITSLSFFGPQKLSILTARLIKVSQYQLLIQWEGISVLKHAQNLHSYCKNKSFWKTLW